MKKMINRRVNVTAVRFTDQFETIPQRIEYKGRSYSFIGDGRRVLLRSGGSVTRWFDMSDGIQHFRLRADSERDWHLLTMS
jgi:hypothetical protein